jgi:hypothetical protein
MCFRTKLTQSRHPGNEQDTEIYFMHCPEAAQPTVTFLGVVLERGGQLNGGPTLLHYRLQTAVYNSSARTYHSFPVTAYFKNGQRLANFPTLKRKCLCFLDRTHFRPHKGTSPISCPHGRYTLPPDTKSSLSRYPFLDW